jgi:hypothetical protein
MSLIKSADVPKHLADRLRSRRIAARLSGGAAKQPMVPSKAPAASKTSVAAEQPTQEVLL